MAETTWTRAHDINEAGQVAVQASSSSGESAVIWEGFTTTVLDLPQGMVAAAGSDINDSGQVAGTASDGSTAYAVRWDNGVPTVLSVPGQVNWGEVRSINNVGQVVGRTSGAQPIRWDDTTPVDLQVMGWGDAYDINDGGQSVGWMQDSNFSDRVPVRWDDLSPVVLPLPVGEQYGSVFAYAINNSGQIAGRLQHDPVRWDNDIPIVLDLLPGTYLDAVSDINNTGQVVGWVVDSLTGNPIPVIWDDTSPMPLPLPVGVSRGYALGLNDFGQVVGYVDVGNEGICYAARWDPVAAPIPEPSTILLIGTGLVGLVAFRKKFGRS
jgi:uncharacterized membrane protein